MLNTENITIISPNIELDDITDLLSKETNRVFKPTKISGLVQADNTYYTLQVKRLFMKDKNIDDEFEWQLDVTLTEEKTDPLANLNSIDYLLKAYAIDNTYYPRWYGFHLSQTDDDFRDFMAHQIDRYLDEKIELNENNTDRLEGPTMIFSISFHSTESPVELVLTTDMDTCVGYDYHDNNGCIGRRYLYKMNLVKA